MQTSLKETRKLGRSELYLANSARYLPATPNELLVWCLARRVRVVPDFNGGSRKRDGEGLEN